jgi:hypothetical protein
MWWKYSRIINKQPLKNQLSATHDNLVSYNNTYNLIINKRSLAFVYAYLQVLF